MDSPKKSLPQPSADGNTSRRKRVPALASMTAPDEQQARDAIAAAMQVGAPAVERRLRLQPGIARPCLLTLCGQRAPDRDRACFIIACELHAAGATEEAARAYLLEWADTCEQPNRGRFTPAEVLDIVDNAFHGKKPWRYGCDKLVSFGYCRCEGNFALCHWRRARRGRRRPAYAPDVLEGSEWRRRLKPGDLLCYRTLPRFEQLYESAQPTVPSRKLAQWMGGGVSKDTAQRHLYRLRDVGLVRILADGSPRRKGEPGKAPIVERVLPVPTPQDAERARKDTAHSAPIPTTRRTKMRRSTGAKCAVSVPREEGRGAVVRPPE